jgi:hypothetical protein
MKFPTIGQAIFFVLWSSLVSAGREKMFVKLMNTKSNGIPLDTFPFNDPGMCQVMMAFVFHLTESLRFRYNCNLINLYQKVSPPITEFFYFVLTKQHFF